MMPEQQQRILGYFIEEAKDHLNTIEQGLLNLQATIEDQETVNEVFRAAHSIKGGAAMLGIDSVQRTSHRLEDYFKILKESPVQVDRTLESMFLQVFDGLQSLVEELQGPFGLTDEKAQEVMVATEPVFGQLESHLNKLVQTGGAAPAVPTKVTPAPPPAPAARVAPRHTEESALKLVFRSDVPGHLREMLNLFKQPDTADSRRSLQSVCGGLLRIGEQFELEPWCSLIRTTQQVVGNPEQTYRTLAPVVIKELKQGQEQVLSGRSHLIAPSEAMAALVPAAPAADEADLDELLDAALSAPEEETDFADLFGGSGDDEAQVSPLAEEPSVPSDDLDWLGLETSSAPPADDLAALMGSGFGGLSHAPVAPGAEVGAAELNSLADLFEGDVGGLDSPWQEGGGSGDRNGTTQPLGDDFSDLLISEEEDLSEDALGLDVLDAMDSQQELASLFGDVDLEGGEEPRVSETSFPKAESPDLSFPDQDGELGLDLLDLAPDTDLDFGDGGFESGLNLENWPDTGARASADLVDGTNDGTDFEAGLGAAIADMESNALPPSQAASLPPIPNTLDLFDLEPPPSVSTPDPEDFFDLGSSPASSVKAESTFDDWFDTPTVIPPQKPTAPSTAAAQAIPHPESPAIPPPDLEIMDLGGMDLDTVDLGAMDLEADLGIEEPELAPSNLDLDLSFDVPPPVSTTQEESPLDLGIGTIPGEGDDDFDLGLALDLGDGETALGQGLPKAPSPNDLGELAIDDLDLGNLGPVALHPSDGDPLGDLWDEPTTPGGTVDPWATEEPPETATNGLSTLDHLWDSLPIQPAAVEEPDVFGDLQWDTPPPPNAADDLGVDFSDLGGLKDWEGAIAPDSNPGEAFEDWGNLLDSEPPEPPEPSIPPNNPNNLRFGDGKLEDAFDDLESLLGDESPPDSTPGASSNPEEDDFDDLDALLSDQPSGDEDEFGDLDALLVEEESAPLELEEVPEEEEEDDDFRALENLLGEADKTLGGPPAALGRSAPSGRVNRRTATMMDQTMRVSVKHLDTLSNLVGELVVNRNSLEQDQERLRQFLDNLLFQVQQLNDVGQRMRDLYERSLLESSLISSRHAFHNGPSLHGGRGQDSHATGATFDALEMDRFTGFHTLSQEMIELIVRVRESASDIGYTVESSDQITRQFRQVTTQLQEGLNKARMVPFAQTADRLPRAVRDISMKCGKEAQLVVEGRDTLIDKMILERLYDPMTHLVNNAITHGIETPDERMAAGKPREGTITVRAFYQGNQTVIYIADDGGGINPDIVKQKAIKKGLITQAEARAMSTVETYELLFRPGFSTRDQADDFAGRGVGMDVVRTALSEIRGAVTIDSELGRGTSFTIRLPLTLSISKALRCLNNQAHIAFPMDGVEDMFDVPKDRVQVDGQGRSSILWRDTTLQFQPLSDLLHFNRTLGRGRVYGGTQDDDMVSIVVLRSANTHIGLQVDRVLGEQEIVIKQLEGPVPKPVGIAGATVLGDGRVMPIADVLELIDLAQGRVRRDSASSLWGQDEAPPPGDVVEPKAEPTVLIVDDSITVRELLSMSFNKVGYRVEQARDGQEAWEKLRSGLPCDLVFCDIEMPRMDGLELLSRLQKDPTLKAMPIAMLTSRGADRHRQMALDLGASGYFTKPYLEEALLDAAQRMLNGEVLLQAAEA